jgi:WD40 repeat protein
MRLRLLVTMTVLALAAAACSTAPGTTTPTNATVPSESVLLAGAGGPVVVQIPSGSVVFDTEGAVSSLGGRWLLSSSDGSDTTVLETRDGSTGEIVATSSVPGDLDVRIVSESGDAVALMDPLPSGWDPHVPLPRATTRIVVADPDGASEPQTFDLVGNFEPEAFSADDGRLFLIQHLPAETPRAYRVAMLDLARGKVLPVFGPFKGPAERMPGIRLQQTISPDADQLYTLYSSATPGYTPHSEPSDDGRIVSFVHVLSLQDGWAHCVGLPRSMWDRPSSDMAIAPSPDGTYLFVVDAGRGEVAVMDTESLRVRSGQVDLRLEDLRRTSAQVSADGETLYVATSAERSTITAIDVRTFDVVDRWDVDGDVTGLGLSADGERLLAATSDDGLAIFDLDTGEELDGVTVRTPEPVTRVIPLGA